MHPNPRGFGGWTCLDSHLRQEAGPSFWVRVGAFTLTEASILMKDSFQGTILRFHVVGEYHEYLIAPCTDSTRQTTSEVPCPCQEVSLYWLVLISSAAVQNLAAFDCALSQTDMLPNYATSFTRMGFPIRLWVKTNATILG